jgi:cytoskeletal protein RodZ
MASFGDELRRERELRRITLREVAESTKVSRRYLEALENNDFDRLPGGVFNRGFVRAYAQYIGIDPDAMVDAYLLEEQAQATRGKARDRDTFLRPRAVPERGGEEPAETRDRRRFPVALKWALLALAAAALLIGAVFLYLHWRTAEAADPRVTAPAGTEAWSAEERT